MGLTSNSDTFSSNPAPVQVVNVKFLSKLGAGDGTAGDVEATNDANAHFIQVIVEQKAVNNLFIEVVGEQRPRPSRKARSPATARPFAKSAL